jgi:ABC-type multidrug transport system ATPase subunit
MLRLLTGYLKPESRQIRGVSRRPAVVFQEDRLLLHLSAEENLAVVSPDIKANREVLKTMGVEASQLAAQLSGGERRRVALARALVFTSSLFILDEPYRSLDPALARYIESIVRERTAGSTVIEVSHRPKRDVLTGTVQVGRLAFQILPPDSHT